LQDILAKITKATTNMYDVYEDKSKGFFLILIANNVFLLVDNSVAINKTIVDKYVIRETAKTSTNPQGVSFTLKSTWDTHTETVRTLREVLFAEATHQQEALWQIRRNIGHAVRANSAYREEDVCVPRTALPEVLQKQHELEAAFGFRAICYGHAGDGNIHINILRDELTEAQWQKIADEAIAQLFEKVAELKGTLSGEHGIGWVQKRYMPIFFPAHHLSLMHNLKLVFDPNSILNPHKILPNE
jgi:FAD/FMN-containing dehydrogenase